MAASHAGIPRVISSATPYPRRENETSVAASCRATSYCRHACSTSRPDSVVASSTGAVFFAARHRPVERAGVNRDSEPPRHGRRQRFVRLHVFARAPALDVVDNRVGAFVGVLRPGTLGYQPGDPVRLERGRGLVERLAADPETRGDLGHRPSIDPVAAHHLVLDLHAVARVERMAQKGVVADGLGMRMQGSCLAQGLRLGVRR